MKVCNGVYVNKYDFLSHMLCVETVPQAIRLFLVLVFVKDALLVCTVRGNTGRSAEGEDSSERAALSQAGCLAVHSECYQNYFSAILLFYISPEEECKFYTAHMQLAN